MSGTNKPAVYLEKSDAFAIIRLNRPDKRNAVTLGMWEEISRLVRLCEQDEETKVIIFTGVNDAAFSAGAYISEFQTLRSSKEKAERYNRALLAADDAITACVKPTIAMIRGVCVGGGCLISLACDFRFSNESAVFGITPAKLGIVYNLPCTKNLVDVVGPSHAKDILFTGRLLPAEEALSIGLINRIYGNDELEQKTFEYARLIANNAQNSVRGAKRIVRDVLNGEMAETPEVAQLVLASFESDNFHEGIQAFLSKRRASFK